MDSLSFLKFNFVDAIDIILVGLLLFYFYKLVKGTVAINIFRYRNNLSNFSTNINIRNECLK